ncbi:MAG: LamG domain-containing protein [Methanolobus sp.]
MSGACLRFDGNGDYLSISDNASLDFDENMSILFWLRLSTSNDVQIIGKGMNDQDNFELFVSGGELYFEWADSPSNYAYTSGMDLTSNAWYQIGVVVDGEDINFYKDAVFVEKHSMGGVPLVPNDYELWIGRQNYGSNDFYLRGYLDEIEIYDVALSESDVGEYYARTNP